MITDAIRMKTIEGEACPNGPDGTELMLVPGTYPAPLRQKRFYLAAAIGATTNNFRTRVRTQLWSARGVLATRIPLLALSGLDDEGAPMQARRASEGIRDD